MSLKTPPLFLSNFTQSFFEPQKDYATVSGSLRKSSPPAESFPTFLIWPLTCCLPADKGHYGRAKR